MAKQQELKKKILKILLPKVLTGVLTFQNHQVDHKYYKHHGGPKGSIMMIPDEARRRRSKHGGSGNRSTKSLEPTSPTVSCMGQIKLNKNQHNRQCIKKAKSKRITLPNVNHAKPLLRGVLEIKNKKQTSTFRRIFRRGTKSSRASEVDGGSATVATAPALRQMKRYASGRGALANFDWKKAHVVAPGDDDDDDVEDDEPIISFSEPIVALRHKTEINLWKRRNMAPPPPVRLNPRSAPI